MAEGWRYSGLSQNRFARDHGIDASYLSRWKGEFPEDGPRSAPDFVVVHLVDPPPATDRSSTAFHFRLPWGIAVSVPPDFETTTLERLISTFPGASKCAQVGRRR